VRVGILTFHHSLNPGAWLQVAGLMNILKSLGLEPVIIDYLPKSAAKKDYRFARKQLGFLGGGRRRYIYSQSRKIFPKTIRILCLQEFADLKLDTIILGSDEIWNFKNRQYAGDIAYFGGGAFDGRLISYAASMGEGALESLPEKYQLPLKRISSVSVRDKATQDSMLKLTGKVFPMVLDPTLIAEALPEKRLGGNSSPSKKFWLFYAHQKLSVLEWNTLEEEAFKADVDIISVHFRHPRKKLRQIVHAGPDHLAWLFRCASGVITTTFHGVMLSLRYRQPFLFIPSRGKQVKLTGITDRLDVNNRLGNLTSDNLQLLTMKPEWDAQLNVWKSQSIHFLKKALLSDQAEVK